MEVVIPTYNDYRCLPKIIRVLERSHFKGIHSISQIHVIDNNSKPEIGMILKRLSSEFSKVIYHFCSEQGKGNALRLGIQKSTEDLLFVDADIENFSLQMISPIIDNFKKQRIFVKAYFVRSNGQSNSAFVLDELRQLFPRLKVRRPTCGIYCVARAILEKINVSEDWSCDLSILIQAHLLGFPIVEVEIGEIKDKARAQSSLLESKDCLKQEIERLRGFAHGIVC